MNIKRFKVGKTYDCESLYGGWEVILVVGRNDSTISYVHADDDEQNIQTKDIIMQKDYDWDTLEVCGECESIIAWEYIPCEGRYGDEKHYGYFIAEN